MEGSSETAVWTLSFCFLIVGINFQKGVAATCPTPASAAHSSHNGSHDVYEEGHVLYYTCDTGYILNVSRPISTCLASGEWDPPYVDCELDVNSIVIAVASSIGAIMIFVSFAIVILKRPCCQRRPRPPPSSTDTESIIRRQRVQVSLPEYPPRNGIDVRRVSLYDSIKLEDDRDKTAAVVHVDHDHQNVQYDTVAVVVEQTETEKVNNDPNSQNTREDDSGYDSLKRGISGNARSTLVTELPPVQEERLEDNGRPQDPSSLSDKLDRIPNGSEAVSAAPNQGRVMSNGDKSAAASMTGSLSVERGKMHSARNGRDSNDGSVSQVRDDREAISRSVFASGKTFFLNLDAANINGTNSSVKTKGYHKPAIDNLAFQQE